MPSVLLHTQEVTPPKHYANTSWACLRCFCVLILCASLHARPSAWRWLGQVGWQARWQAAHWQDPCVVREQQQQRKQQLDEEERKQRWQARGVGLLVVFHRSKTHIEEFACVHSWPSHPYGGHKCFAHCKVSLQICRSVIRLL